MVGVNLDVPHDRAQETLFVKEMDLSRRTASEILNTVLLLS